MILDDGICCIYGMVDQAQAGDMPDLQGELKAKSWYKELDFETTPAYPTEYQEDIEASARIRITQDRRITNKDTVILCEQPTGQEPRYEITRAYHGHDDESGQPITDLTLQVIQNG